MNKVNLINKKFNRWVVTEELQPRVRFSWERKRTDRMFLCTCECWNTKEMDYTNIFNSMSCWCYQKEIAKWLMDKLRPTQLWENNPNWKWWITEEYNKTRSKERNTKESRLWTILIKERDWECKKCWATEFLQSHHIESWTDNPEKRLELDNWVCLCKFCHHEFHKQFWFGNNNLEQLDQYLL